MEIGDYPIRRGQKSINIKIFFKGQDVFNANITHVNGYDNASIHFTISSSVYNGSPPNKLSYYDCSLHINS